MSTKNISRSALEGGRSNYNKWERNNSHRQERARARNWLAVVRQDPEAYDETSPRPRDKVSKGFTDKLNPAYRWIDSHVGQPWSVVFSKLAATFDTRKLSSWHVVNQHMLAEVLGAGSEDDGEFGTFSGHRWLIDDNGILRRHPDSRYWKSDYGYQNRGRNGFRRGPSQEEIVAWLNGRKVIIRGEHLFWATGVMNSGAWVPCHREHIWRGYWTNDMVTIWGCNGAIHRERTVSPTVKVREHFDCCYRQDVRLSPAEKEFFLRLPPGNQEKIMYNRDEK